MVRLGIRRGLLLLSAAAALAVLLWSSSYAAPPIIHRYVYGVDLQVTCVQVKKENRDTIASDTKISPGVKSALIAAFGLRYKRFTFISEQSNMLSWRGKPGEDKTNQDVSKRASFDVGTDKQLTISYLGFRRSLIMFNFEYDAKESEVDIQSGAYYVMKVNNDTDPLVVIVHPKLIEEWH